MDYWRLCDELSVMQAVLLFFDCNPDNFPSYIPYFSSDLPQNASALLTAINNAIAGGRLNSTYVVNAMAPPGSVEADKIDANHTRVLVDDFRTWLRNRGVTTGFFFPDALPIPDYLNPEYPYYSRKLAAAIRVWEAVTTDTRYRNNGKTAKQNIIRWLYNNAQKFGLVHEDGKLILNAIENQIAKVANWEYDGGAPTTPGGK